MRCGGAKKKPFYGAWWKRQSWNVDCRPSTTFSTGRRRPDGAFLLVDVVHPDVFLLVDVNHWAILTFSYWSTSTILTFFNWSTSTTELIYWSTSTRLRFSTGRRGPQSSSGRRWTSTVDAVDVHFTDVFITPILCQTDDKIFVQKDEKNDFESGTAYLSLERGTIWVWIGAFWIQFQFQFQ